MEITSYYSPRNRERPLRSRTDYIILHTTEGPARGSLRKVRRNGETHYFVNTDGHVYRIISKERVAFHTGRSMWGGKTNLDNRSLGIEVVGYHNKNITTAQYQALRELLRQLQSIYHIPDERVLSHSMIAYGVPNTWHKHSHRGRKRCGMLFARESVRKKLGLDKKPRYDPDVKAGRLVVGDPYLAKVLYGREREVKTGVGRFTADNANIIAAGRTAWDIAGDRYNSAGVLYRFPDGKELRGDQIIAWKKLTAGTIVVLGERQRENELEQIKVIGWDGKSAREIAGDEYDNRATIYFLPDGRIRRGDELTKSELAALPVKTRLLVGYIDGGYITARRSAFDICGSRWKLPDTFYRFSDSSIVSGSQITDKAIPEQTRIFFRN
ncbi:MAG: N-acetylmuramoyl-L-alanine amidase [Candidatus Euphemobacter frigidus]|nr:N-acetylmuramoyl-L-alanine amidase [Candidatus Euphemobacter frigidus]MDP8274822.1 N-acetylmuramoyl-L-alanine amidase [Candidatus Euphemobacter frigidus]